MWLIPGKTKVKIELFKGVSIADILIGVVGVMFVVLILVSNLPHKFIFTLVTVFVFAALLTRIDGDPNYIFILHILKHIALPKRFSKVYDDELLAKISQEGEYQANLDIVLSEDEDIEETEAERKLRLKRERIEYKEDSKKLRSKTLTKEEEDAIWLKRYNQSQRRKAERKKARENNSTWEDIENISPFTDIKEGFIDYNGQYYGTVIEISPVEFRFFSETRRNTSITQGVGRILRSVPAGYSANIVKIDRPVSYDSFIESERAKIQAVRSAYEKGMMREEELKSRIEVIFDRIAEIEEYMDARKVIMPFYYICLFDSNKVQLDVQTRNALNYLEQAELEGKRLDSKELALFLKYSNTRDFDEKEIDILDESDYAAWARPNEVSCHIRNTDVDKIKTHTMRIIGYPTLADDAWLASVLSMDGTKCVIKAKPLDMDKAVRGIDRSLSELRGQYQATNVDSKIIELQTHIESLGELLSMIQGENENLLSVNVYVTVYDYEATKADGALGEPKNSSLPRVPNMKRVVKRIYREHGLRLSNMDFEQVEGYIASQISAFDPFEKSGRGMPSNSISAAYPWIFPSVSDVGGIKLGEQNGVPVFIDFFRRDSERVNSNMVIVGKSGSGKSFATKSLLANLAADDSKIFILDPENEYAELAENMHGKFINVGNAQHGRLNPFHIMTDIDDEEMEEGTVSGSYATHLQFLEEFFRQIMPDCEKDAMEYLNSIVDRMYTNKGINSETDLTKLSPEDFPIFDDLYDAVLNEFQQTNNTYVRSMLRTLMNHVAKFSTGGRNANIWNGPSTVTTDENFSVFNFQSLLANRNSTIANAQMLLVLKYIDNEVIKNRDYNTKNNMKRKVIVVIDEAHVFIDEKFPVALDFMFQLAKRIRKYNGMQIVITQNIKDFVGTEELVRKSTAIINACQYSFVFPLAANDMDDLCKLYDKAGGINKSEQENIVAARRGQAFTILSPTSRSSFQVEVPAGVRDMFENPGFVSGYFGSDPEDPDWIEFLGDSKLKNEEAMLERKRADVVIEDERERVSKVIFEEITEEEYDQLGAGKSSVTFEEITEEPVLEAEDEFEDVEDIPSSETKASQIAYESTMAIQETQLKLIEELNNREEAHAKNEELLTKLVAQMADKQAEEDIKKTIELEVEKRVMQVLGQMGVGATLASVVATGLVTDEEESEETKTDELDETFDDDDFSFDDDEDDSNSDSEFTLDEDDEDTEDESEGPYFETDTEDEVPDFSFDDEDEEESEDEDEEEEEDDDEDDSFDIMAVLFDQVSKLGETSSIEKMELYDETVIDITVEELAKYVSNMRKANVQ